MAGLISFRCAFAIAGAGILSCATAQAACTGGVSVKGSFGVVIHGPVVAGGTEVYGGVLTSDGKCGLTGTLTGGLDGSPATNAAVTGTYSVPTNGLGSMSLLAAGSATPMTFSFGVVKKGKELLGNETDKTSYALLDAVAIAKETYTDASVIGNYVVICSGIGRVGTGPEVPGSEVNYETYDGAGNYSGTAVSRNGDLYNYNGTYTVAANGSFSTEPSGDAYRTGAIVSSGSELLTAEMAIPPSAVLGPYEACVAKK